MRRDGMILMNYAPGADPDTVTRVAIETVIDSRLPDRRGARPGGAEGQAVRRADRPAREPAVRAALAGRDRVAVRHRQHAHAVDLRAHARARACCARSACRARQVRRVVRYEAVITALLGALLGSVLGIFFAVIVSRPLADEGFNALVPGRDADRPLHPRRDRGRRRGDPAGPARRPARRAGRARIRVGSGADELSAVAALACASLLGFAACGDDDEKTVTESKTETITTTTDSTATTDTTSTAEDCPLGDLPRPVRPPADQGHGHPVRGRPAGRAGVHGQLCPERSVRARFRLYLPGRPEPGGRQRADHVQEPEGDRRDRRRG